jgi:hypothetical protein
MPYAHLREALARDSFLVIFGRDITGIGAFR